VGAFGGAATVGLNEPPRSPSPPSPRAGEGVEGPASITGGARNRLRLGPVVVESTVVDSLSCLRREGGEGPFGARGNGLVPEHQHDPFASIAPPPRLPHARDYRLRSARHSGRRERSRHCRSDSRRKDLRRSHPQLRAGLAGVVGLRSGQDDAGCRSADRPALHHREGRLPLDPPMSIRRRISPKTASPWTAFR
jgi:hypothetical protein